MSRRDAYSRRDGAWQPTDRQREVLDLLLEGKSNAEIAARLGITVDGAKWHVSELLSQTGCVDRQALAAWWRHQGATRRNGLLPLTFSWRFAAGLMSFASLIAVVIVGLLFVRGEDGRSGGPFVGGETSVFPDIAPRAESVLVPTAMPSLMTCPAGESDLRTVEPAELRGQGLVAVGRSFFVPDCPILIANRDDRAFVRVPLETEVSIAGEPLPGLAVPWAVQQTDIEVASARIVVRVSRNGSYEGSGMEFVLQAWNAEGSAFRMAVDSDGGLWVSPDAVSPKAVFEHWTGDFIDTSAGNVVGALGSEVPGLEAWAMPVFYFTSCFEGLCQVSVRPGEPLVAPVGGVARCIVDHEAKIDHAGLPIGEIELDTGEYKLRFVELYTSAPNTGDDKGCETRTVAQGDRIGSHYHYAIFALSRDGARLSVAVSQDGTLYVGEFGSSARCPCLTGH